jgi:hypothetical protein
MNSTNLSNDLTGAYKALFAGSSAGNVYWNVKGMYDVLCSPNKDNVPCLKTLKGSCDPCVEELNDIIAKYNKYNFQNTAKNIIMNAKRQSGDCQVKTGVQTSNSASNVVTFGLLIALLSIFMF